MSDFSIVAQGLGKRYFLGEAADRNNDMLALKTFLPSWKTRRLTRNFGRYATYLSRSSKVRPLA